MCHLIKQERLANKLNQELGPVVLSHLSRPDGLEVLLNADGNKARKGYVDI